MHPGNKGLLHGLRKHRTPPWIPTAWAGFVRPRRPVGNNKSAAVHTQNGRRHHIGGGWRWWERMCERAHRVNPRSEGPLRITQQQSSKNVLDARQKKRKNVWESRLRIVLETPSGSEDGCSCSFTFRTTECQRWVGGV